MEPYYWNVSQNIMEIYTDGACNSQAGGIGIVFIINGKKSYEFSKKINNTTNNKCELLAVIYALHAISKPIDSITIYSDSQYVLGCITKGWKRTKNADLWKLFDKVYDKAINLCPSIEFKWVKGHAESEYNCLADKLAVEASLEYE